tara:strand:+ start:42 stop:2453 length:2412 start_codon:yes stop_codon:yes gene_type:complete
MGGDTDKDVIFSSGSVLSGTKNFTFDYTNNNLILTGGLYISDDNKIFFGTNEDASIEYDENGTDELRFAGAAATFEQAVTFDGNVTLGNADTDVVTVTGQLTSSEGALFNNHLQIVDDKKLRFGSAAGGDATIEYDENGTDELRFAGAAVTFEQAVTFDANVTLGDAASDVITTTGRLTASQGMLAADNIGVIDDKKVVFGTNLDSHIEYNEDGDNLLIISGSSQGVVLSGSTVFVDGNLDVESLVRRLGGSEERIQFADSGMFFYAADSIFLRAAITDALSGSVQINNSQNDVDFSHRVNSFVGSLPSLQVSASDGIIHSNYGVTLHDDQKLTLGSASDAHLEYNEDGDNLLIISGSAQGIVLSGSTVTIDGTLVGPSLISLSNDADNRVVTAKGDGNINAEANLTFDGSSLILTGNLKLSDDVRSITFAEGTARPAIIEYKDGAGPGEYLRISGSSLGGTVISGSKIIFQPEQQNYGVMFQAGDVVIVDDIKLNFGTLLESHIEYNEDGDNLLIVSGSSQGMVLSGSNVSVDGAFFLKSIASGSLSGPGSYVGVNDTGQLVLTASSGGTGTVTISNDGDNRLVTAAGDGSVNGEANLTFDGSNLFVTGNINLADDKKIYIGASGDAHIEYNEDGDDLLIISGSTQGMVLSGSTITLDGAVASTGVTSGSISGPGSFLALNDSGQFVLGTPTAGSVTIANDADNRITTAKGDGTLNAEANLVFNGATLSVSGSVSVSGSLEPNGDAVYNLGSPTHRWANVYTGDLHLRNDRGDWTIVEEEDYLTITNNKKGKRYKFVLEEID